MREALKKLTGESVIYGLGQASGRAVQLLLVPVLTRLLAPGEFGIGELVIAYSQTAVLVLVFGMDGALARFFYGEPDRAARIRMVSTSFLFRLVIVGIAAAVLALASGPVAGLMLGGEVYRKYLLIGAATLPFTLFVLFANDVLRVTFQPWKFITLNLCQTLGVAVVSIWLVVFRDAGVSGMLYGRLAGDGFAAIVGLVLIRHNLGFHFRRDVLLRMLAYGTPLVPVALAYGVIAAADRFALQRTRSLEEVAIYAVGFKFFAIVTMGISAFQLAYGPFAFARASDPAAPRIYARVFAAFVALGSMGALVASAFSREIVAVLAPATYQAAALPAAFLAFAAVAQGAYYVASVGIGLALRTPLLAWAAGGAALVAVIANAVLTPRWGAVGAGIATLTAYAASALLTYVIAQRVYPVPYRGLRMVGVFMLALAMALALVLYAPTGAAGVVLKIVSILVFAGVCTSLRIWWSVGAVSARGGTTPPSAPDRKV